MYESSQCDEAVGTITCVGRYLKRQCPTAKIILADLYGSRLAHFVDSRHADHVASYQVASIGGSEVIGNLDLSVIDGAEVVPMTDRSPWHGD